MPEAGSPSRSPERPGDPGAPGPWTRQDGFALRFDWGPNGLRALAPAAEVVVVVDVLRFTTAVSVAVTRGATVIPYRWHDGSEAAVAEAMGAELAGAGRGEPGRPWSLSPTDLAGVPAGTRLLLPSPNGSALAHSAAVDHGARVLAGCLRNARATAAAAVATGGTVAVVAAGERWRGATGPLRPAVEDLLGAGAVIAAAVDALGPDAPSPEARAALAAFRGTVDLPADVASSASGRELAARGWLDDVATASALDADRCAAALVDGEFVAVRPLGGGEPEAGVRA